jgi:hypothetical protein
MPITYDGGVQHCDSPPRRMTGAVQSTLSAKDRLLALPARSWVRSLRPAWGRLDEFDKPSANDRYSHPAKQGVGVSLWTACALARP